MSTCLVCYSSIVATCPPIPATHFAFRLWFIGLVILFVVVVSGEPRQKQGQGLVDHKLVQAPPVILLQAALLFWFFGGFRFGVPIFIVMLVIY